MIPIENFIESQLNSWPQAQKAYTDLNNCIHKEVLLSDTYKIGIQYNAARLVSTGAKVDNVSIKNRPCFLCEENRPREQYGLAWREYEILLNPFPIFPRHLTIPAIVHCSQSISGRWKDMGDLANELKGYIVFYNGPKCGASAPDHMHFQAVPIDSLPLIRQLVDIHYVKPGIGYPKNSIPGLIIIDVESLDDVEAKANQVVNLFPICSGQEPMMNIISYNHFDKIRFIIIPRKKHRPSFYGSETGKMLLSPATIDLAGVMITPRIEDFNNLNETLVQETFEELCYNCQEIKSLCEKL